MVTKRVNDLIRSTRELCTVDTAALVIAITGLSLPQPDESFNPSCHLARNTQPGGVTLS